MNNLIAALAVVIVLQTGYTTAVLANEKGVDQEQVIGEGNASGTGSEASRTDARSIVYSLRSARCRTSAEQACRAPFAHSSVASLSQLPAKPIESKRLDLTTSSGAKAIWIYLGTQEAFLTENDVVMKMYRISSGAPSTPTPLGVFQIYEKEKLRVSSQAVAYRMPNYMAFTEDDAYGLHGLPYLGDATERSGYWNEALSHIGVPVSHGCVRFLPEEALEVFKWADVGTPVIIQD